MDINNKLLAVEASLRQIDCLLREALNNISEVRNVVGKKDNGRHRGRKDDVRLP